MKNKNIEINIYEPTIDEDSFEGLKIENDFDKFKENDIIVANRIDDKLKDVEDKVYSRDLFKRD